MLLFAVKGEVQDIIFRESTVYGTEALSKVETVGYKQLLKKQDEETRAPWIPYAAKQLQTHVCKK